MSYRELRNFVEMMRSLNYPRLISLDNFRSPNFPLVSEILLWFAHRLKKNIAISSDVSSEEKRVRFICEIVHFLLAEANVTLNTKRLYQADGHAVKELLKLATLLRGDDVINTSLVPTASEECSQLGNKTHELRHVRGISSKIILQGSTLHELLESELDIKKKRDIVDCRSVDLSSIETSISAANHKLRQMIERTEQQIASVANDEESLNKKLEHKQMDVERSQKRLATLSKVRPAFMDELERLEEELKVVHEEYVSKFRCLSYLESMLEKYEEVENKIRDFQQEAVSYEGHEKMVNSRNEDDGSQLENGKENIQTESESVEAVTTRVFGSMQADFDELESDASIELNDDDLADAQLLSDDDAEKDNSPVYGSRYGIAREASKNSSAKKSPSDFDDDF